MGFDVTRIRADFPILNREIGSGIPVAYLEFHKKFDGQ